jgi:hypothetical protein
MQRNNTEDENQAQNQHNDRVHLETGALVRVKAQHRAGATTSAGRAGAAWPSIGNLLLLVGSSAPSDRCPGAAGNCWAGRAGGAGAELARGGRWRGGARGRLGRFVSELLLSQA